MLLIRRFEEKVEDRFRAGELPGIPARRDRAGGDGDRASCAALAREDVIASTHRAHGHAIAKGTPVERIMAELYGKLEGCSHGYGGSMHLYDVEVGNLGANAVVGGGLPGIVGAALAFQMRGEKRVAVAFLGDGATNTGTFHESLNLAQLWKVPAIFVLENNGWAESTPASQQLPLPVDELGKRALAVRDEAHRGRRPGRRGRLPRHARRARARARRARARCSSISARTASRATTSATRRSTATRTR